MKFTKEQLSNFLFIIAIGVILFTPIGFHVRVLVSRIVSFSPSELDIEDQVTLSDYDWKLYSVDGNVFDFKDTNGKVVLVNFWATWCPPCVAEMPSLQKLYNDYGDKVEFVFVAHDTEGKVKEFLTKKSYDLPIYFESSKAPKMLTSENIPTTYILNSQGRIVIKKTGAADWSSEKTRNYLDKLLEDRTTAF